MNLWEEIDACKFEGNEYLVEHLVEVVKDEGINSLEELKNYEERYFIESGMKKEDWVRWYEKSFETIPDLKKIYGEVDANKIKFLMTELKNSKDINQKIENIIRICIILEKEFCFLVEAYNLILDGKIDVSNTEVEIVAEKNKNIVLCGSMKFKTQIMSVGEQLKSKGYNVIFPEECMRGEEKKVASRAHFKRILDSKNNIILVVNVTKNGIPNYIGPNTLAEIAFGFYYNKKVCLLNNIYQPYGDELLGWGVIPLKGNLDLIAEL